MSKFGQKLRLFYILSLGCTLPSLCWPCFRQFSLILDNYCKLLQTSKKDIRLKDYWFCLNKWFLQGRYGRYAPTPPFPHHFHYQVVINILWITHEIAQIEFLIKYTLLCHIDQCLINIIICKVHLLNTHRPPQLSVCYLRLLEKKASTSWRVTVRRLYLKAFKNIRNL